MTKPRLVWPYQDIDSLDGTACPYSLARSVAGEQEDVWCRGTACAAWAVSPVDEHDGRCILLAAAAAAVAKAEGAAYSGYVHGEPLP